MAPASVSAAANSSFCASGGHSAGGGWRAGVVGWLDAMAAYRAIALAPYWVMGARLAGFDGDELVLLDDAGGELGRLVRADP
ncbi:hypothetical protein [Agromyces sp. NPDC055658]